MTETIFAFLKGKMEETPFDVKLIIAVMLLLAGTVTAEQAGLFSTDDFVEANVVEVDGTTITLGHDCHAIVAQTTPSQARSIRLGKEGRIDVRPTTHDVLLEALDGFNITVKEAALTRFEDDIYFGRIVFRSGDRVLRLDSRPTDAIATALRADAPIFINQTVLRNQGENIC